MKTRLGCLLLAFGALPLTAADRVDFARDIQPIFASRCYECHGERKQKSGLRLDDKALVRRGGESGKPAIVSGSSSASHLIQLVSSPKPDERMPQTGEPLSAAQIALLRAWIDQGANWPDALSRAAAKPHWAFIAPQRPAVPKVQSSILKVQNPVDNFVLAKLEREKLKPSPEADKITLLRRLHLDLTGLPPTIAEVDTFLADKSKDAYAKQVERLLKSPHYGERWGRHWLDAARYADSDGYEKDMSREQWPYRDYVINAFNRDVPYDRFITEQLAGDLLPGATHEQVAATGFLRNSMVNMEGAIDPEQFRMDAMFDRLDAIGKSVLGLTIQCGQCHSHKYDPLTQEEYYRLFAFLNNDHEARPVYYSAEQQMKVTGLRQAMSAIEADLKHRTPDWEERMTAWEKSVAANQPEWIVLRGLEQEGDKSQRYQHLKDGSLLAEGYAPTKFTQYFSTTNDLAGITAFRLELFNDPNLPYGGPGRSFNGTCALSDFIVEAIDAKNVTNKVKLKWSGASADYEQAERPLEPNYFDKSTNSRTYGPIKFAIDGNAKTAWGIDAGPGRRNQERKAVFTAEQPAGFTGGTVWRIGLQQNHGGWNSDDHMNNNLGRFRLSATKAKGAVQADPLPKKVRDILSVPRDQRTSAQVATIFGYWRTTVSEWSDANAKIEALWRQWPEASSSLALAARSEPRVTSMLKRGDWLRPTQPVSAGVPAFLHPMAPTQEPGRLAFARWLVDKRSPTTARVFVNRVWQAYFGTGIVPTPEDFGTQAIEPSHPELLDWLACEFMEHGWSVQHLHRLIVSSATYRQSSRITPELGARDPGNRLLARGPRFRVEGEIVRDIALAASGLLNAKVGGRSVMPPAPAFLFQPPASYAPFPWKDEEGAEKYRRALYTFRRRSTPYPALQSFDVPNADVACVRRLRSNSPLQALVSLNEPLFVEAAQALARRTLADGGKSDNDRITFAFRCVLARAPAEDERRDLLAVLAKQTQRLADGWLSPNEISTGSSELPKTLPPGTSPTQLAAYTVIARVLLNLDETITKE